MAVNIEYIQKLRLALKNLIEQTHNLEKQVDEELFNVTHAGESLPLVEAREALKCPHEWSRTGLSSGTLVGYVCNICGEEAEKDVS